MKREPTATKNKEISIPVVCIACCRTASRSLLKALSIAPVNLVLNMSLLANRRCIALFRTGLSFWAKRLVERIIDV